MRASPPDLRSELLQSAWRALRAAGAEAEELAAGLRAGQLWWRPEPDRWSIGQCLDHLVRTGEAYLEVLDAGIEEGRRRELFADGPSRRSLVGRWLARLLEPPPGLRIPAPKLIRPREPGPDEREDDPLPAFLDLRNRFADRLAAADGLDLGRIRVSSPFVRLLRFDLGSAFPIIAAHERRHLWQARRVRDEEGFPAT